MLSIHIYKTHCPDSLTDETSLCRPNGLR